MNSPLAQVPAPDEAADARAARLGAKPAAPHRVDAGPLLEQAWTAVAARASARGVALLPAQVETGLALYADGNLLRHALAELLTHLLQSALPGEALGLRAIRQGARGCISLQAPARCAGSMAPGVARATQQMHAMGGSLLAGPDTGAQAAVHLWLPLDATDSLRPAPTVPADWPCTASVAAAPAECEVLYVEDNPINALVMEAVASRVANLHLRVAATGEQALLAVQDRTPHVLLLDRHLPDMDGEELLARMHRDPRLRAVPAVMVSADASESSQRAARDLGFCDYWTKPLNVAQVCAALEGFKAASAGRAGTR